MVKVIYNDRVPRLCPAVGQLVVHEGTVVFFRQPFRLILQTTEVASVPLVVDSVVQRNQVRMFFTYIVKDVFFESAAQVQIFQPNQVALILDPLENSLEICDTRKNWVPASGGTVRKYKAKIGRASCRERV